MFKYFLILITSFALAQQPQDSIKISGHIRNNARFAKVVLKRFGIGIFYMKAVPIIQGKFNLTLPPDIVSGVYRLQFSQNNSNEYLDIIIDGKEKNIDFDFIINDPPQLPTFTNSKQNKVWYEYQGKSQKQLYKVDLLRQFINQYPDTKDLIIAQSKIAYKNEITNFKKNYTNYISQNKNSWASEMIENKPIYFTNPTDHLLVQQYEIRNNFWNKINTTNPKLLNSPLYMDLIIEYLKFYNNPDMKFNEEQKETGLKKSIDTIMKKFSGNPETKKFALKYLQRGFKEIGQEKVLQYIDEKYKLEIEQCQNELEKEKYDKRMAGYLALKAGEQAPDISFEIDGKTYGLKNILNEKTVIVFWASWCPHCEKEMPKLQEYVASNPEIGVLAVSLDKDKSAFETAIKKYPNMTHKCDFKEWDGKAVNDYFIYGSPTFIILDKEKKIIGKYINWETMKLELEKK